MLPNASPAVSSHLLPDVNQQIIDLTIDLKEDFARTKDAQFKEKARALVHLGQYCNLATLNPFYVVIKLIEVMEESRFTMLLERDLPLVLALAQALHYFVDLTILRMFAEGENYRVEEEDKNRCDNVLRKISKRFSNVSEIRYAFSCAQEGLKFVKDTSQLKDEAINFVKTLARIVLKHDVALAATTIKSLWQQRVKIYYLDVLELRVLTPFANSSLPALKNLQEVMKRLLGVKPDIEIKEGERSSSPLNWRVFYSIQESLSLIALFGESYAIRRIALAGKDKEDVCLLSQAERALTPPYFDEHSLEYYRAIVGLLQLQSQGAPWMQQKASLLIEKVIKRGCEVDWKLLAQAESSLLLEPTPFFRPKSSLLPQLAPLETKDEKEEKDPIHLVINAGDLAAKQGYLQQAAKHYCHALNLDQKEQEEKAKAEANRSGFKRTTDGILGGISAFFSSSPAPFNRQALITARFDQLWTLEYFKALFPILQEIIANEEAKAKTDKLWNLAAPLYLALNEHGLTVAKAELKALLEPHQALPTTAKPSETKAAWFTFHRKLQELESSQRENSVEDPQQAVTACERFSQNLEAWLKGYITEVIQLLGKAPCDFSLFYAESASPLGTYKESLSLGIVVENDFYRHHPYFQSLVNLLTFSVNPLTQDLFALDDSYLNSNYPLASNWCGSAEDLVKRSKQFKDQVQLQFCFSKELYTNAAEKNLHISLQKELLKNLENDETKIHSEFPLSPAAKVPSLEPVLFLETKGEEKELALDMSSEMKSKPKVAISELTKQLSLDEETVDATVARTKERSDVSAGEHSVSAESVHPQPSPGLAATRLSPGYKINKKLRHYQQLVQRLQNAVKTQSQDETSKTTAELAADALSSITNWCRQFSLYFFLRTKEGGLLQEVKPILERARQEKLLAPQFAQELLRLWELSQFLLLQTKQQKAIKPADQQQLKWLVTYTLQPALQALPIWLKTKEENPKTNALDPVVFLTANLQPKDLPSETKEADITKQLTLLITVLQKRKTKIREHLAVYHQLTPSLRENYRQLIQEILEGEPHLPRLVKAMQRYPEHGMRPANEFLKQEADWRDEVLSKITRAVPAESKRATSLQPAYLEYINSNGEVEKRTLTPALQKQLFNSDGSYRDHRIKKELFAGKDQATSGQRLVFPLYPDSTGETKDQEPWAELKRCPQFPVIGAQATAFGEQICGNGVSTFLARICGPTKAGTTPIGMPVLISQYAGVDLERQAKRDREQKKVPLAEVEAKLEPRLRDLQFFLARLCHSEDGKPGNFGHRSTPDGPDTSAVIVEEFDNDHAFEPQVAIEKSFFGFSKARVNRKNITDCFQPNEDLNEQAIDEFLALDPLKVAEFLVNAMHRMEQQTVLLFGRKELNDLLNAKIKGQIPEKDECYLFGGFKPGTLSSIIFTFYAMQVVLRRAKKSKKPIKRLEFLKLFEREIAHVYEEASKKESPIDRYLHVQNTNPEQSPKATPEAEQKETKQKVTQAPAPTAIDFRPSCLKPTQVAHATSRITKTGTLKDHIEHYSPEKGKEVLLAEIKHIQEHYKNKTGYEIIAQVKSEIEQGDLTGFKELCANADLSYLIERIISKLDIKKLLNVTLFTIDDLDEISKDIYSYKPMLDHFNQFVYQHQILETVINGGEEEKGKSKTKHRFCELNLKGWAELTDKLLVQLIEYSGHTLTKLNLSDCRLTDNAVISLAQACPKLIELDVSGCIFLTGKAIRAIANNCKQLVKLNISNLRSLRTIRDTDTFGNTLPLVFPKLQELRLDNCTRLQMLNTKIPYLKKVSFKPYDGDDLMAMIKRVAKEGIEVWNEYQPGLNLRVFNNLLKALCLLQMSSTAVDRNTKGSILLHVIKKIRELEFVPLRETIGIVDLLLQVGANVNVSDDGDTPLMQSSNAKITKLLLAANADVNARDKRKSTALMKTRDDEIIKQLLEARADVNAKDDEGETALFKFHSISAIKLLLAAKADINAKDHHDSTTLAHLLGKHIEDKDDDIIRLLIEAKADANVEPWIPPSDSPRRALYEDFIRWSNQDTMSISGDRPLTLGQQFREYQERKKLEAWILSGSEDYKPLQKPTKALTLSNASHDISRAIPESKNSDIRTTINSPTI